MIYFLFFDRNVPYSTFKGRPSDDNLTSGAARSAEGWLPQSWEFSFVRFTPQTYLRVKIGIPPTEPLPHVDLKIVCRFSILACRSGLFIWDTLKKIVFINLCLLFVDM